MQEKKVTIYFYNRLFDPLIQGNFWVFINDYLENEPERFKFHLVTYEDTKFPLTDDQCKIVNEWQRQGVDWTPLQWHPGRSLKNKLVDILAGLRTMIGLRSRGCQHLIAYNSVAGSYAYLFARMLGMKLFLYTFEPHSEYSVDNGMLSESSLQYKILHNLERQAANFATVISSGTRFMQDRLENEWKVNGAFFRIPSVVNSEKFTFNQNIRDDVRAELGIRTDQWVLFYPGKFGSLYYKEETAWMYRWLSELESRLHFLIVTPQSDQEVHSIFDKAGVDRSRYTIRRCEYAEVQRYFFAADFAVIAVPPGPSKQFISNIKVGEYLCAGLPFLITKGVSEDYMYAENQNVGVVVDDFREANIKAAWPEIKGYLEMDVHQRRHHCRTVGIEYRGFEKLNPIFKAAINTLVSNGSIS